VLALGEQNDDGQLEGFRRGMSHVQRVDHTGDSESPTTYRGQTVNLGGNIATLGGPKVTDGDTSFTPYLFGNTTPHFVIGADSTGNGHNIFQDQPLDPQAFSPDGESTPPPSAFMGATYHIGAEAGKVVAPQPVTTDPEGLDFYGYAAGVYQQTPDGLGPNEEPVGILANANPEQVHLKFKDENRLSAFFDLTGAGEGREGGAKLAFGDWYGASGRSAVINSNIYAAIESGTVPSTAIVDGDEGTETRFADASLYLVSGELLRPNTLPCENCDFIKWGTWGGQIKFKDDRWNPVTAQVNLGWYVAGNISRMNELAGLTGTATYSGETIGNVAAFDPTTGVWNTYVATGALEMDWDFSQRAGMLAVNNFDAEGAYGPLNVSGRMDVPGQLDPNSTVLNRFGGPLAGTLGSTPASGAATGSFVSSATGGPTAGVIGNWQAQAGDVYGVTGIFAGARNGNINPNGHLDLPPRFNNLAAPDGLH
jgi:hypothetical protein